MSDDDKKSDEPKSSELFSTIPPGFSVPTIPTPTAPLSEVENNTRRIEALEKQRNAAVYGLLGVLILSLAFFLSQHFEKC